MFKDEWGEWQPWVFVVGVVGLCLLVTLALFGCAMLASIPFEIGQCNTLTSMSSLNYEWVFWGGCLVELPNGAWIDADDAPQWMLLDMEE